MENVKHSEAIKEGAKLRPQGFGKMFGEMFGEKIPKASCALGAAYEGTFHPRTKFPNGGEGYKKL